MYRCPNCKRANLFLGERMYVCSFCSVCYPINKNIVSFLGASDCSERNTIGLYKKVHKVFDEKKFGKYIKFMNMGYPKCADELDPEYVSHVLLNKNSIRLFYKLVGKENFTNKNVLDLGCGRGGNIELINRNYSPTLICGIESINNIENNVILCQANIECAFPFLNDVFDVIVCVEVIHNIKNYKNVLSETFRILKSGCFYIADALHRDSWQEFLKMAIIAGYTIVSSIDVTESILSSNDEISHNRTILLGNNSANLIGAKGSRLYDDMVKEKVQYRLVILKK